MQIVAATTQRLMNTERLRARLLQLARRLAHADLVILEELGYLPFSQTGA